MKEGYVASVAFSPDGKTIAAGYRPDSCGDAGGGVVLWDVVARNRLVDEPLAVKEGKSGAWPSAPTARPSRPDTTTADGGVVLWDVAARNAWSTSHSP